MSSLQVSRPDEDRFAEVLYFFQLALRTGEAEVLTLAAISVFTRPAEELLEQSAYTLMGCFYQGQRACEVIRATDILSVVAMVPLPRCHLDPVVPPVGQNYDNRFFVVEKPGLEVAFMAGRVGEEEDPAVDGEGSGV